MTKILRPDVVLEALKSPDDARVARDVTVFHQGEFLFGSFQNGAEQVLDVRAHDRSSLLAYVNAWKSKRS